MSDHGVREFPDNRLRNLLKARIRGVILFGGGGIGLNLAEKAEDTGLHVARIPCPEKKDG